MTWLVFKYAITALLVVLVSETAKRSDHLGALLASLPLVTLLTWVWLHVEQQAPERLASHALLTFWYVLPTLPMLLLFPWLLMRYGFFTALISYVAGTFLLFVITVLMARWFGVNLLG